MGYEDKIFPTKQERMNNYCFSKINRNCEFVPDVKNLTLKQSWQIKFLQFSRRVAPPPISTGNTSNNAKFYLIKKLKLARKCFARKNFTDFCQRLKSQKQRKKSQKYTTATCEVHSSSAKTAQNMDNLGLEDARSLLRNPIVVQET